MLLDQKPVGGPHLDLKAVYEPNLTPHGELVERLQSRGIKIMPSYEALLNEPITGVWLPIPIPLHRPFTEQALAAGKHVLCEKPAAGTIDDVDAMIAAEAATGRGVVIGFQDIYDHRMIELKRKLLDGVIGSINRVTVVGTWPRSTEYYSRNDWAGHVRRGDSWVLDSPVNNAMAHFVNLAAFLIGPSIDASITPVGIEAELYRAYPISNYDTASLRVGCEAGIELNVLMTHACRTYPNPIITFYGSDGECRMENFKAYEIKTGDKVISHELSRQVRDEMTGKIARWMLGEPAHDPVATLQTARVHTLIVNGASDAAAVVTIPSSEYEEFEVKNGRQRAIPDVEAAFDRCAASGKMLHESGEFSWTQPGGKCDLRGYHHFRGDKIGHIAGK